MDGWTDIQLETIIPCHYPVAGYKNVMVHMAPDKRDAQAPRLYNILHAQLN